MTDPEFTPLRPSEPEPSGGDLVAQQFPYDGPHSPERTATALEAISGLVRYVNNATSAPDGLGYAPQVYTALGYLRGATGGLDQLLRQLRQWAQAATRDETVRHDRHRADPDRGRAVGQNTAASAATHVENATQHANALYAALSAAHSELAHLCHDLPADETEQEA